MASFPNYSQSLMNFGNALANRKQRRAIKRQQEEAAAARRAASNARSNRGLVGTLGGVAGAAVAGMAGGYNPATMALGYQLGSTLGSGLSSMTKPYNQQELTGMPYTQPSSFETINQVAPQVMGAYGAFQERELAKQQNDYTTNLNNLLKVAEFQDMAPAATTGMINQLNASHRTKYDLGDESPSYMLDFNKMTTGVDSGAMGYRAGIETAKTAIESAINRGAVDEVNQIFAALSDSQKRGLGTTLSTASANAQFEKDKLDTSRKRAKQLSKSTKNTEARNAFKLFDGQLEKITTPEEFEQAKGTYNSIIKSELYGEMPEIYKNLFQQSFEQKEFELTQKPKLDFAREYFKELQGQGDVSKDIFIAKAKETGLYDDQEAAALYDIYALENQSDRDDKFIEKMRGLKLTNTDILGNSVAENEAVLKAYAAYYAQLFNPTEEVYQQGLEAIDIAGAGLPQDALKRTNQKNQDSEVSEVSEVELSSPQSSDNSLSGFIRNTLNYNIGNDDQAEAQQGTTTSSVEEMSPQTRARPALQSGGQENQVLVEPNVNSNVNGAAAAKKNEEKLKEINAETNNKKNSASGAAMGASQPAGVLYNAFSNPEYLMQTDQLLQRILNEMRSNQMRSNQ